MEKIEEILQNLVVWLSKATGISVGLYSLLFTYVAGIAFLWSLRWLILKLVWRQTENLQVRYKWRKISGYAAFVLTVLLVGRVLSEGFHSAATFLGLLTAGLAIALKDPLVNLVGWMLIIWRRPFAVGDRIQIGIHAGDVMDLTVFRFTLAEIGNWVHADQITGRIVHKGLYIRQILSSGLINHHPNISPVLSKDGVNRLIALPKAISSMITS